MFQLKYGVWKSYYSRLIIETLSKGEFGRDIVNLWQKLEMKSGWLNLENKIKEKTT